MRFPRAVLGLMLLGAGARAQSPQYTISTVAGGVALPSAHAAALSTGIGRPAAIAADAAGNVYFASSTLYSVFKMDASGTLTVVAGNGHAGDFGDGGPATAAQLSSPSALALDPAGNLYIADGWSGRVRKVSTEGIIHTIAGTGVGCCYNNGVGDGGPATAAQLFFPYQVAADAAGNVYIGEWNTSRVRKVSADGIITTVVGTGSYGYSGDGGPASAAAIGASWGLTFDRAGSLYFSDAIGSRPGRALCLLRRLAARSLAARRRRGATKNNGRLPGISHVKEAAVSRAAAKRPLNPNPQPLIPNPRFSYRIAYELSTFM